MLFSSAGTFLTKYGESDNVEVRNWKWHPEKANAAVFYYPGQTEFNYDSYFKIAELTNTGLTIQQINVIAGEEVVLYTYVLTAE